MYGILLTILVVVGLLVILLPYLADEKTKLFRRIWSTERMGYGDSNAVVWQAEAMSALVALYGINATNSKEVLRKSVAELAADALTFDLKNPRNSGIEVMPVVLREIRLRFPEIGD